MISRVSIALTGRWNNEIKVQISNELQSLLQFVEMPPEADEFLVGALLCDFSFLEHHNDVGVLDCLDPVSDVDAGAMLH